MWMCVWTHYLIESCNLPAEAARFWSKALCKVLHRMHDLVVLHLRSWSTSHEAQWSIAIYYNRIVPFSFISDPFWGFFSKSVHDIQGQKDFGFIWQHQMIPSVTIITLGEVHELHFVGFAHDGLLWYQWFHVWETILKLTNADNELMVLRGFCFCCFSCLFESRWHV